MTAHGARPIPAGARPVRPTTADWNRNSAATISRDSRGASYRWSVRGENLNAGCNLPGNLFTGQLVLLPNPPALQPAAVTYGPIKLPEGFDRFTFFFKSAREPAHGNALRLEVQLLSPSARVLADSVHRLTSGDDARSTLGFSRGSGAGVAPRFTVEFEDFADRSAYGSVRLAYMLSYEGSALVDLCNAAGSDKGTEVAVGDGVPHCYAIDYSRLFACFRDDPFNLLEIGLENPRAVGRPSDAPSLRVWREFFPRATIYGFDINDFGFFTQDRTITFQGDQSSRGDLDRFVERHGWPRFRVVIDDGSHASSHQQGSLAALFRYVEGGGMYIIEDLHWQPFPESPTTLEMLRRFSESNEIRSPFVPDPDARYLEQAIDRVVIHRPNDAQFAVIRKK